MNGIHDMGGMQDMGPMRIERHESLFHAPWERRMFALFNALDAPWAILRSHIDMVPPAEYLRISYYERWLAAIGPVMTKTGMVTPAELESGTASGAADKKWHVLSAAEVATWTTPDTEASVKPTVSAKFHVGQRVRARNMNPVGHTRLPRYTRGKVGTIGRDRGVESFPDTVAQGLGEKLQHVYCVRFAARELWGEQANPRDSVYVDLWEDYLEPA